MYKGIDVSKHQGKIDWKKVSKQIDFAILRVGYGKVATQKDSYFEYNYQQAKKYGVPVGAYHYSYAKSISDAEQESKVVLEWLKGKQFEYPIYFDIEDNSQINLGKDLITDIVFAFCEKLEKAGYFVGVYSNTNWLTNYLDYKKIVNRFTIWKADYRQNYDTSFKCDIHQYSCTGKIDGINGNVDLNNCFRDFSIIKQNNLNGFKKSDEEIIAEKDKKIETLNAKITALETKINNAKMALE